MINPRTVVRNGLRRSPLRRLVMMARHTGLRHDDIFLASYPRSGNTWMKSLLASCLFGKAMENFSDTVNPVIPIVGYHRGVPAIEQLSARIIKTHEAWRPAYRKAIWIVRDPRDVVLSEFKLQLRTGSFGGSFEQFVERFVGPDRNAPPNWATHTSSWHQAAQQAGDAILCLHFEELKRDPKEQLARVLRFLNVTAQDAMIDRALEQNSIAKMAQRHASYDATLSDGEQKIPAVNKGQAGGWRTNLSVEHRTMVEDAFGDVMEDAGYERAGI